MEVTITATEANRKFSDMLRGVRKGRTYVITSRGEVVAELRPVSGDTEVNKVRRQKALDELLNRVGSQTALNLPHITRDEMHDR